MGRFSFGNSAVRTRPRFDFGEDKKSHKIDMNFIRDQEGFESEPYIPRDRTGDIIGQSGVTIGSGIDLGQQSEKGLRDFGVSGSIIDKISPFLGKKKLSAQNALNTNALKLDPLELDELDSKVKESNFAEYINYYEDETGKEFNDLDPKFQTAIGSVITQYGPNLKKRTPKFNKQILENDVQGAREELENFGDQFPSRRKREAGLLEGLSFLNPFHATEASAAEIPETRFDFTEISEDVPELRPSTGPQFAEDSGPVAIEKGLGNIFKSSLQSFTENRDAFLEKAIKGNDFVGGAIDILTGGMSIKEAEEHRDIVVEKAKRVPGSLVDLVRFSGDVLSRDLKKAERFIMDPIGALTSEPPPEKTIEPGQALEGFSNILEFIFNPYIKSARAIGGFVFPEEEGALKTRLAQSVKDTLKDPGIGFISQRIGEDIFTGEEGDIERIAKVGGVATVGTIAEILTFNPRGIFNRLKKFPTDQKIARMNEIIAEVEKDVPRLKGVLKKARPDLPPHVVEQLSAREFILGAESNTQLGNYLKAIENKVAPRFKLATERGVARIPFKKGDIVKIGKETGKFVEEVGGKALVEIAGKEVTKEFAELIPEKPVKPEVKEEIVKEEILPKEDVAREIVPELKNTEEAITFGEKATSEQVGALKTMRKDAEDRFDSLFEEIKTERTPEKVNKLSEIATEAQFYREAIEAHEGKIKKIEEIKPEEEATLLKEFNEEVNQLVSEVKKNIKGKIKKGIKGGEEERLIPKQLFAKEGGEALDSIATENADTLGALGYEGTGDGLREFIQDNFGLIGEERAIKQRIQIEQASTRDDLKKLVEKIGKKLAKQPTPGKVKGPILEKVGIKKIEKPVVTTERAELKRRLRTINNSIKEGIREGVALEKVRANQKEAIRLIKKFDKTRDQINAAIELEAAMPAPLEAKSSAFNEHIAYFQTRQIPPGSKVRGLLSRIRTIDRLRRSRKITAGQANRISRRLRKELFNQADKEGVAIRMTPGGKIVLAVRQSGVFVPKEFAEYPNFKNLSSVAGGGTDVTRMMEGIDGALTVSQKKGLPGQAGQAVQQVLWPTRDMMVQKMSYIEEKLTVLKRIFSGIKSESDESVLITKVAEQISIEDISKTSFEILQNPDINKISKSKRIVSAAKELRVWFTDMIAEINAARELRNQDLIPVRDKYIPHEFLDQVLWEQHGVSTDKASDVTEGAGNLPSYIKPNKPFNAREKAREFGIPYDKRVLDSVRLAENYIATAAKDIFNTSIIQNNKAFIQQLETLGFDKSAKTIADWTAEAFAGIRPVLDNAVNLPQGWTQGLNFFNRLRNAAVFPFNFAWNVFTQTSSITLTLTRYGGLNTLKGLANWTLNPKLREKTAKEYFSFIIKSHKQGRLSKQDAQNLIGQDVKIYRKPSEVIEDFGTLFGDSVERLLTGASIEAARLKGIEKGLTGDALRQFASDGGGKTQSMYNAEDKPGVLRSTVIKTISPYQTFTFEVANTFREWMGKTGTPPDDATERMLWLIRFMSGVTVTSAIAAKNGKKLWDWMRAPLPFAEYWYNPIMAKLTGEYTDGIGALPSPTQAASRVAKGLYDYLETGNTRKLRNEILKWTPGLIKLPGGISISRAVDGWIAYAEGGIYDRRGRKMFGVETPEDLLRAMLSGVWSTKGGQEYLKKRESKLDINLGSLLDDILGIDTGKRRKRIKRSKRKVRERRKKSRRFNF